MILYGDKYFENMIHVVDEGFLATRNGRIIYKNFNEIIPNSKIFIYNNQVCFNEDIEYDFGGQIWAGRISWFRKAWTHIPISIENCEDFWLSATLKTFYNISTRTPKCPCPQDNLISPDLCSASDISATGHINPQIGKKSVDSSIRGKTMKKTLNQFNYKPLIFSDPKIIDKINNKFFFGNITHPIFNLSNLIWKSALFWQ